MFIALLPALGLILYQAAVGRAEARAQASQQVLSLALIISETQQRAIVDSGPVLRTLAAAFEVSGMPLHEISREPCDSFVESVRRLDPVYLNIGLAALDGSIVCSALPVAGDVNISDRLYFREAISTKDFAVGEYQIGRVTGRPSINTGLPVLGGDDQPVGVVFAALDLRLLSRLAERAGLPEGAVVTARTRDGTVIMRYPDPERWIGKKEPDSPLVRAAISASGPATAQLLGLDGVQRIYGIAPLITGPGRAPMFLAVGVPTDVAFSNVESALWRSLIGLGAVTIAIVAAAWVFGEIFVLRKTRSLVAATRRLAAGDAGARSGLAHGQGELGELARSFDEMADALHERQTQLAALNAELDQKVQERTAQLQSANQELESFSYSVSHDLRAPLRAIAGFSQIVAEEYGDKLDFEGKRYLRVIQDNTEKMGQLIDDLLNFSRVGRKELSYSRVDMTRLAREVLQELESERAGRQVDIRVAEMPAASGDPALLKLVFANLLSNALKFSRAAPVAQIEASGRTANGEHVYWVKDNGVGFDPRYGNKLFGVFQRLHSSEEFEGTGVGLALVHRIVSRHGGRAWAEGAVGKGATFWFALPAREDKT